MRISSVGSFLLPIRIDLGTFLGLSFRLFDLCLRLASFFKKNEYQTIHGCFRPLQRFFGMTVVWCDDNLVGGPLTERETFASSSVRACQRCWRTSGESRLLRRTTKKCRGWQRGQGWVSKDGDVCFNPSRPPFGSELQEGSFQLFNCGR